MLLWADRSIVHTRLLERHKHRTAGVEERLVVYDQEVAQLADAFAQGELDVDLIIVNNGPDLFVAADMLLSLLRSRSARSKKKANAALDRLLESPFHQQDAQ